MLTDKMKDYLSTSDKDAKWDARVQATYNYRVRQQTKELIEDLTFITEHMPDKDFDKVFTEKEMERFFKALFTIKINSKNHEEWLQVKNSKQVKRRRKRTLELSKTALTVIAQQTPNILPESLRPYLALEVNEIQPETLMQNLKGLLYARVEEL